MIRFETDLLLIRDAKESDFESLLHIYQQEINMTYISNGRYNWTIEEVKSKYQQMNDAGNGFGLYIVELKVSKEVIGEAGLFNSFCQPEKAELGYIIDHKFWEQGYGTEICSGLIRYAFETLYKHTVVARMYAKNMASVRLSEKLGMVRIEEGFAENGEVFYTYELKNSNL